MKIKIFFLLLFTASITWNSSAQNKFGKVTMEELQQTKSDIDEEAYAEYFLKTNDIWFSYNSNQGFIKNTDVRVVLKIYNKNEGADWADVSIVKHRDENISGLKAITHNLKDGRKVSVKLKKKDIFKEYINDNYTRYKFTLPDIKDGSVLEWKYTITSPYKSIRRWYFQSAIPVKYSSYKLTVPEYYTYQPHILGYEPVFKREVKKGNGSLNIKGNQIAYSTQIYEYVYKNLPALKDESFVFNINNYRNSVKFELSQIKYPMEPIKSFSRTWNDVAKTLMRDTDFGLQLKKRRFLKEEISKLQAQLKDLPVIEKLQVVLKYIREKVKWNEKRGLYTKKGVKKAFVDKEGNAAEINLLFITILRELGLNANPLVLSTTDNGRINYNFPSLSHLNYTISAVEEAGRTYLIDAANKYSGVNSLPRYCLNYRGFIILKDTYREIEITTSRLLYNSRILCSVNDMGEIEGDYIGTENGSDIIYKRKRITLDKKKEVEKVMKEDEQILKENIRFENAENVDNALITKYQFVDDINIQEIQDKLFISPLLFTNQKENPFKKEVRKFPVELGAPFFESKVVSLKLPADYTIESLPKSQKLVLPNNLGVYMYIVGKSGDKIIVQERIKLNSPMFLMQDYPMLRKLFISIMEIEKEKIVLKKKS